METPKRLNLFILELKKKYLSQLIVMVDVMTLP